MIYPHFAPAGTHLLVFFRSLSACGVVVTLGTGFAKADVPTSLALGRHLAAECSGCHSGQTGGAIPVIAGRSERELLAALKSYASGILPDGRPANPAMASVAQSLSDTEMAAVSGYLATLPPAKSGR